MSVPTRYNPKKLTDYAIPERGVMTSRGRRRTGRRPSRGRRGGSTFYGPTAAERSTEARAKYKAYIEKDIADSERRRTALEAMWQSEKNAETAARKQAVEEYNTYAAGAPDPKTDIGGEGRAAYFNTPLGKAVTDNLQAHIQSSMNKRKRNDPNAPENRSVTQGEYEQAGTVGEKFTAYGRRIKSEGGLPKENRPVDGEEIKIGGKKVTMSSDVAKNKEGKIGFVGYHKGRKIWVDPKDYKKPKKSKQLDYVGLYTPKPFNAKEATVDPTQSDVTF